MMLNKIKILPDTIANKIAAGEVVQRPESVVKELIENAIDAGAVNIDVIVKKAGKNLIQVCDDGSGMTETDLKLSIQKHATSKISAVEDLEVIRTFGFRGEALSSIAAVSQFEIRSETRDEEFGTSVRLDEMNSLIVEKGSFQKGTCVIVKNLFYNVPARRKFLKSDNTELKHIFDTFNKIALSKPSVHFRLYNDDTIVFDYNSGNIEERIKQVFADNMLDALIPVELKTDFIEVNGFVGKPSLLKKSKGEQYLFLNSRYIINKQINHAVFTAYENVLEKGDYPFFILFIDIDPEKIDVNIHPSKLEARFDDEKDIYNLVLSLVKKSLAEHDLVPSMVFGNSSGEEEKIIVNHFQPALKHDFSDRPVIRTDIPKIRTYTDEEIDDIFGRITGDEVITSPADGTSSPFQKEFPPKQKQELNLNRIENEHPEDVPFILQLHTKYILSQIRTGLMIIDQHVAHERILYEKALNRIEADIPFSQQLLFPKTQQLDPARYNLLRELYPHLSHIGFEIKFLNRDNIVILGVPDDVKKGMEEITLLEIIDDYAEKERTEKSDVKDKIAKSYSCKAAIKAGDKLTEKEMRLLIDQLFATSMPYVCPHGRPIVIKISLEEFDRRFGRT